MIIHISSNNIKNSFLIQSLKTSNRIFNELETNISIGEESLTDINLQDLQINNSLEISTKKFDKRQEGKNGADWEWWFISDNKGFGLRVQAKKLNLSKNVYPDIDRHINGDKNKSKQIDLLIKESLKSNFLPIYVFYSYFSDETIKNNCKNLIIPKVKELLGCSFVPAETLKTNVTNLLNVSPKNIQHIIYPWHCLFCDYKNKYCINFTNKNSTESLPDKIFNNISYKYKDLKLENKKDNFITNKLPEYVNKISNGDTLTKKDIRAIKTKYVTIIKENING